MAFRLTSRRLADARRNVAHRVTALFEHVRHSLGLRLALQFASLFTAAMMVVALALSFLVVRSLSVAVEGELRASGAVFDRLWQQRAEELSGTGETLARDFGFRAAVATGDEATMRSALDNMRGRAKVAGAFILGIDGRIHGLVDAVSRADAAGLWDALDQGRTGGVAILGGKALQLVAAPILAPQLNGWLVLADDIDQRRMRLLEQLSAVPLHAGVLVRQSGRWRAMTNGFEEKAAAGSGAFSEAKDPGQLFSLEGPQGGALALARPIPTLDPGRQALLLLTYPKHLAYAQQRWLLGALALLTLLGLAVVVAVTWRAAGRIIRPLERLDEAAARIADGASERVEVRGQDELARLGHTFNRMAGEIEERERRITHLAFNDTLTGLPNRAMFHEELGRQLRGCASGDGLAIHCLDLDNFKATNDTLGHPAGDALLMATAERLTRVAQGHFVARLSGDEFVVIQRLDGNREAAGRLARAMLEALARTLPIDGHTVQSSVSIGIALFPQDGEDASKLMSSADLALYRAKDNGRGNYAYFEEALNERAQHRRQVEADLHEAIQTGQFKLVFQPQLDLASGAISAFEALIRWQHPVHGLVSPLDFIPVAEETGLIVPIGAWVIHEACREAARWPDEIRIAVNVSSIQFYHSGLAQTVVQALAASGLAAGRLEIELTESVFLEGDDKTHATLHSLRQLGVRTALDDFGTGYSSLSYLQSFPFDKLKIDQSFIRNLLTQPGAIAVVRAIIDLATALGMTTTAEGVEEPDQLAELKRQGCATVQGYLFSRPIAAQAVPAFIQQNGGLLRAPQVAQRRKAASQAR